MKQSIFSFLAGAVITGVVFYFVCCQNNCVQPPTGGDKALGDTILNGGGYVLIRTDTTEKIPSNNFLNKNDIPVDPELAQEMIKSYLAGAPADATHYASFSFMEIFNYLGTISRQVDPTNFGLRFYFGKHTARTADPTHPVGSSSLIIVATDANRVDYYNNNLKPIDYGNLCPPSTNCADSSNSTQLIYRARRM